MIVDLLASNLSTKRYCLRYQKMKSWHLNSYTCSTDYLNFIELTIGVTNRWKCWVHAARNRETKSLERFHRVMPDDLLDRALDLARFTAFSLRLHKIAFNHSRGRFPVVGLHVVVVTAKRKPRMMHRRKRFPDASQMPRFVNGVNIRECREPDENARRGKSGSTGRNCGTA